MNEYFLHFPPTVVSFLTYQGNFTPDKMLTDLTVNTDITF